MITKGEAFEYMYEVLRPGQKIYVVRTSQDTEFNVQWCRFYHQDELGEMCDMTAYIAATFDLTMVYGDPMCRIAGHDDESTIKLLELLSKLLFDNRRDIEHCRL